MTLKEAGKRLADIRATKKSVLLPQSQYALMLGIAAIESLQQIRKGQFGYICCTLPGEKPE